MQYLSLQQGADEVLRMSRRMRDMARMHDWDALARLEQQRQQSLESLFAHPQMPQAMHEIAGTLQQIIELDRESIDIGQQERDQLGTELDKQSSQGGRALQTYLTHSR
jgi:hypothetical protein